MNTYPCSWGKMLGAPAAGACLQKGSGSSGGRANVRNAAGKWSLYREKGLNDVRLDGAERLVFDDNEDLLLFFQVDEVTEPGFLGKSKGINRKKKKQSVFSRMPEICMLLYMLTPQRVSTLDNLLSTHLFIHLFLQLLGDVQEQTEDTSKELKENCTGREKLSDFQLHCN